MTRLDVLSALTVSESDLRGKIRFLTDVKEAEDSEKKANLRNLNLREQEKRRLHRSHQWMVSRKRLHQHMKDDSGAVNRYSRSLMPWRVVRGLLEAKLKGLGITYGAQATCDTANNTSESDILGASLPSGSEGLGTSTDHIPETSLDIVNTTSNSSLFSKSNSTLNITNSSLPVSNNTSKSISPTIPFGFQLISSMTDPNASKTSLKKVLYIPHSAAQAMHGLQSANNQDNKTGGPNKLATESDEDDNHDLGGTGRQILVTLDTHKVSVLKGSKPLLNIDTSNKVSASKRGSKKPTAAEAARRGVIGMEHFLLIEKWRVFIVFSNQLQLKVLDMHFSELAKVSCPAPIVSMEYVESKSALITGETGSLRVWSVKRDTKHHIETYDIKLKVAIENLFQFDQWVMFVQYDRTLDRIIASCDSGVYYFDFETGQQLDQILHADKLSITCTVLYEPMEYLITAAKSGTIKVWNSQNYLIHEFNSHTASVTCLKLMEPFIQAKFGTFPIVLSSSLDGTLRLWNIDLGLMLYRIDIAIPIYGLSLTAKETILIHSKDTIQTWSLNRSYNPFSFSNVQPFQICLCHRPNDQPSRILAGYEDGSIRLISPVTGEVIIVGFPIYKNTGPIQLVYDTVAEKIYARHSNGDIILYSCKSNPMKVIETWEPQQGWEPINCITGIHFVPGELYSSVANEEALERKCGFKSSFFLVGGAVTGQLVYFGTHHKGKQDIIVQAHSAEITSVLYDHINFLLITAANDFQIKVWKIIATSSLSPKEAGDICCPLFLECDTTLTLSQTNDTRFENPKIDHTICINPIHKLIAFAWNGKLRIVSYSNNQKLHPTQSIEKTLSLITSIANNPQYDIWATADTTGSVKIWDNKGLIIREILFDQSISSIQFANLRGDLLFGLRDQIAALYLQSYFNIPLMKHALESSTRLIDVEIQGDDGIVSVVQQKIDEDMDPELYFNDANGYQDGIIEHAMPFDSNLDFWEIFYKDQKLRYSSLQWHVNKEELTTNLGQKIERDINWWERHEVDYDEARKRRNRRLFLESEVGAFEAASKFDQKYVATKHNAAHTRDSFKAKTVCEEEPAVILDGDYVYIRRVNSSDLLLETGLNVSTPRNEPIGGWKTLKSQFIGDHSPGKFYPLVQTIVEKNRERDRVLKSLENPNKSKKLNLSDVVKRREEVQKNLKKVGTAIPNSVLATRAPVAVRKPSTRGTSNKKDSLKNIKKGNQDRIMPEWWFDEDGELPDDESVSEEEKPIQRKLSSVNGIKPPEAVEISRKLSSSTLEVPLTATGIALEPSAAKKENQERRSSFVDVVMQVTQTIKSEPEVHAQTPLKTQKPKPPLTEKPKQAHERPKTKLFKRNSEVSLSLSSNIELRKPVASIIIVNDIPPLQQTSHPIVSTMQESQPSDSPPLDYTPVDITPSIDTINLIASNFEFEDISDNCEQMEVEDMNLVSEEEAAAYAWNLLRMRNGQNIPRALGKVVKQFWFKSPENDPLDLEHVIKALINLMHTGEWSECCEASKAMLFLYMTFKTDIPDPYYIFILPHLEVLDRNEFWQVRAQLCSNLSAFQVYHQAIYRSLIMRLNDINTLVKISAKKSLIHMGIDSKSRLFELMKSLGFFGVETQYFQLNRLEVLEKQLIKKSIAVAAESAEYIRAWQENLSELHCPGYEKCPQNKTHRRRPSYEEHLAGPFFQDKKTKHVVPPIKPLTVYDFKYADAKEDVSNWNEYDNQSLSSSIKLSHLPSGTKIQQQNILKKIRPNTAKMQDMGLWDEVGINRLTEGRPTSASNTLVGSSRPMSAAMSVAIKMARPISAGLRAMGALDYRRTLRPKSAFPETLQDKQSTTIKPRPLSATTSKVSSFYLSPYLDGIPYSHSEAFLRHKPKTKLTIDETPKSPWH